MSLHFTQGQLQKHLLALPLLNKKKTEKVTQNTKTLHLLKLKLIPNKVTLRIMNESRDKKKPNLNNVFGKTRVASKGQNPSLACSEHTGQNGL
jgi:hypothetical protein